MSMFQFSSAHRVGLWDEIVKFWGMLLPLSFLLLKN